MAQMFPTVVILVTLVALNPGYCNITMPDLVPDWYLNFTALDNDTQLEVVTAARTGLIENAESIQATRGRLIGSFRTDPSRCALACGVAPDCHFIKISKRPSDGFANYTCSLYSEFGDGNDVIECVNCMEDLATSISKWLTKQTAEWFVEFLLTKFRFF